MAISKEKKAAYDKVRRKLLGDVLLEKYRSYYQRTKEARRKKIREWQLSNLDKHYSYTRAWEKRNSERVKARSAVSYSKHGAARAARYRSNKFQACPRWADLSAIREIYRKAKKEGNHVDHIIPLQNSLVCGLHVAENLQILSPQENRSKSNKFLAHLAR